MQLTKRLWSLACEFHMLHSDRPSLLGTVRELIFKVDKALLKATL